MYFSPQRHLETEKMLIDANGIFKIKNSLGWQMKNGAKYEYTYEQIECENVAYERRRHVPSVSFWTTTAAACHRGSNSHKNGCYSNLRSIKYFNLMPSVSGAWVSLTCDSTFKKRTHGIKRWKKLCEFSIGWWCSFSLSLSAHNGGWKCARFHDYNHPSLTSLLWEYSKVEFFYISL